jgi:hypothetical protein
MCKESACSTQQPLCKPLWNGNACMYAHRSYAICLFLINGTHYRLYATVTLDHHGGRGHSSSSCYPRSLYIASPSVRETFSFRKRTALHGSSLKLFSCTSRLPWRSCISWRMCNFTPKSCQICPPPVSVWAATSVCSPEVIYPSTSPIYSCRSNRIEDYDCSIETMTIQLCRVPSGHLYLSSPEINI